MKKSIRTIGLSAAAAAAAIGMTAAPAIADEAETAKPELTKGEERLAKMLEGRVAGEPESCISTTRNRDFTIINRTALVYGRGNTIWVNIPNNARQLDDTEILVTRSFGGTLCKQSIVNMIDGFSGMFAGPVFLGDFVPYRRVDS